MASKIGRWLLFIVLFSSACFANQAYVGYCSNGGTKVVTSGLNSTTSVMASYPGCTVTVNNLGGGLAAIFSDNLGTPLSNPFQASLITGQFIFYANNARYSITLSGGTPLAFPLPVTITDVLLNDPASPLGCLSIPALTGDVTSAGGTCATVLPNIAAAGTGLKTTINAKGQVTGVTTAASTDLSDTAVIARLNVAANFGANPVTTGALVSTTGTFSGSISGTGATFTSEVAPSVTGVQLGDTAHRWDLFARNIDWSGTLSGGLFSPLSLAVTNNATIGGSLSVTGPTTLSAVTNIVQVNAADNLQTKITNAGSNSLIVVAPGSTFTITSKLLITVATDVTVEGYGSTIICNLVTDCIQLGATQADLRLRIRGFIIKPGNAVAGAAIHAAGFDSSIADIQFLGNGANRFNYLIENDNDQALKIDNIQTDHSNAVVRCDATFCGSAIFGPGPNATNAGIFYISNSDFSMACSGNGIDNNNGNDLRVSNAVIQAFNQFGIRASAVNGANDVNNSFDQVHIETGNCTNPLFGIASTAAYILEGIYASVTKGLAGGVMPQFTVNGVTGATVYQYWIVAVDGGGNKSMPMAAGYVTNGNAVIDGTHTVSVVWNKISNAATYDILRQTFTALPRTSPFGTGNFAVTTGYTQATCGANICSFTDNVTAPAGYTVLTNQGYMPILTMWPGSFVLSPATAASAFTNAAVTYEGNWNGLPVTCIDTGGFSSPVKSISYKGSNRGNEFSTDKSPYSPCTDSPGDFYFADNISQIPFAHLIPAEMPFGAAAAAKGVLNFGGTFQGAATGSEYVTFHDDNPAKTLSTPTHRPAPDAGDGAICKDSTSGATMCEMAKTSWSWYINTVPDGTSWKAKLTSSTFTLASGVGFNTANQITSTLATGTAPLVIASTTPVANLTVQNCSTCVLTGTPTGTGIQTATLKTGTGAGNYTSASITYVRVDSTNLAYTVTIPTGWKLMVNASGTVFTATAAVTWAVSLADGSADNTGILIESSSTSPNATTGLPWALNYVIAGDGASHTINLQYKTTNGADSVTMANSTSTFKPTMTFLLTPSN